MTKYVLSVVVVACLALPTAAWANRQGGARKDVTGYEKGRTRIVLTRGGGVRQIALVPKKESNRIVTLVRRARGEETRRLFVNLNAGALHYIPQGIEPKLYKRVPLKTSGSEIFTALVPKTGKGPILIERSGEGIRTGYAQVGLP